ncbi:MAG: sodium-translocating pyrophosphatase [Candidatus Parcubacteria bacterium]|nr:sodium-translocating pyrophosphatase [Candidatus Parcubacteria bacterium]
MASQNMLYYPVIISIFAIIFTYFLIRKIQKAPSGSGKMIAISSYIQEGAMAFLKRQYISIAVVAAAIFLIITPTLGLNMGIGFLIGAFFSALAGFIGMVISTKANLKVAESAKKGLSAALDLSIAGGAVTGLLVAALSLLSISLFYYFTNDLKALIALGFGASLISIFARLGGGIYTKAADVGADLVGKIEKGIPEDDPRNPAVIADLVGDNVGDCAGMAADLFETYVVTIISAMVLASLLFPQSVTMIILPLILGSWGLLASIAALFFIKLKGKNILGALYKGLIAAGIISAVGFYPIINNLTAFFSNIPSIKIYLSSLMGLIVVAGLFIITDYFTAKEHSPVKQIARSSETGPGTNIITGLAVGMKSTAVPVLLISFAILMSFWFAGMYGLAIAAVSMLSLAGIIVTMDSYGPITDNAGGIAEMAGLPENVREVTDALDEIGNTTKAVTKAYAIGSAGLAALVLFSAFTQEIAALGAKIQFLLNDPQVLVGLFIGGLLPYYFASLAMEGVGRSGAKVVEEVRRQFREIPGIMEGKGKPEYGKTVDIVTKAALKEMIAPAMIPLVAPILVGFVLGVEALGGLLIGALVTGLFIAISMTSGGAAWDNAKKYIEKGNLGGKGSDAHKAAVVGDIVGDPYKDTAGPAINPMIKILNIVALLIVGFLV